MTHLHAELHALLHPSRAYVYMDKYCIYQIVSCSVAKKYGILGKTIDDLQDGQFNCL